MDSKEMSKIAKTIVESMLAQNMTASELIMTSSLIDAMISKEIYKPQDTVIQVPITAVVEREAPPKKQGIKYGGPYDPVPPMNPEPVPARVETGRVLAHANDACLCNICNKVVYVVNKDIRDNCKVVEFIDSFTPMPGFSKLPKTSEIQNIDGTICTDCPSCNGSKTLYLTGKPSAEQFNV